MLATTLPAAEAGDLRYKKRLRQECRSLL